jgi:phasin family protein
MYPFSHSVTPAVRSHLDAQFSFFNDVSKSLSRSFLNLCELNVQLGHTLLEEGNIAGQQLLTTENGIDAISMAASRAQPAAEKLRAYQQHMSRVVADTQLELSRVTEQHAQVTSRTARDLADQVAQVATEETEKHSIKQQEMMKNFRDPFQAHTAGRGNGSAAAHGNMQSAGDNGSVDERSAASIQGGQPIQQPGNKGSAKPS